MILIVRAQNERIEEERRLLNEHYPGRNFEDLNTNQRIELVRAVNFPSVFGIGTNPQESEELSHRINEEQSNPLFEDTVV